MPRFLKEKGRAFNWGPAAVRSEQGALTFGDLPVGNFIKTDTSPEKILASMTCISMEIYFTENRSKEVNMLRV